MAAHVPDFCQYLHTALAVRGVPLDQRKTVRQSGDS